ARAAPRPSWTDRGAGPVPPWFAPPLRSSLARVDGRAEDYAPGRRRPYPERLMRAASPLRVVAAGLALVMALTACGPQPPDAATLLKQSSQRMLGLKGFHFQMQITGF